ncbi:MAG TPA: alpha/beta hydrolase [Nocardioidaceae bacterium]|nr:alpha/beta hydrolase [Nocardioidaceae bacterium]
MTRARALLVLAGVVVLLLTLVWGFQRSLIYFPASTSVPAAGTVIPGARDVELHTDDGLTLGAWLVPAEEPTRGVTVLVANGNGGDRSIRAPLARELASEGMDVLLFDYRGYGGNPGSPSEDGLALDIRAARAFLADSGVPAEHVLYFGESLGSAVVTELATEHPPAAMLLRSPFVDLASLGRVHYPFLPVRSFLRDRFPLVEHLTHVDVPVTVVYGSRDSIVPPDQSRAVAEAAPNLRRLVEVDGADHNDMALLDGADLVGAVVDLAERIAPR